MVLSYSHCLLFNVLLRCLCDSFCIILNFIILCQHFFKIFFWNIFPSNLLFRKFCWFLSTFSIITFLLFIVNIFFKYFLTFFWLIFFSVFSRLFTSYFYTFFKHFSLRFVFVFVVSCRDDNDYISTLKYLCQLKLSLF